MIYAIPSGSLRPLVQHWLSTGVMSAQLINAVTELAGRTASRCQWKEREDMIQNVFFELLRKRRSVDADDDFGKWVVTLALNRIRFTARTAGRCRVYPVASLSWKEQREVRDLLYAARPKAYRVGPRECRRGRR